MPFSLCLRNHPSKEKVGWRTLPTLHMRRPRLREAHIANLPQLSPLSPAQSLAPQSTKLPKPELGATSHSLDHSLLSSSATLAHVSWASPAWDYRKGLPPRLLYCPFHCILVYTASKWSFSVAYKLVYSFILSFTQSISGFKSSLFAMPLFQMLEGRR